MTKYHNIMHHTHRCVSRFCDPYLIHWWQDIWRHIYWATREIWGNWICNLRTHVIDWVHEHFLWIPQNSFDDESTLVQIMKPSHNLWQWWHRPMSLYGVTRPQVVSKYGDEKTSPYNRYACVMCNVGSNVIDDCGISTINFVEKRTP